MADQIVEEFKAALAQSLQEKIWILNQVQSQRDLTDYLNQFREAAYTYTAAWDLLRD